MSCSNCYNGCAEIVSDKCVRYTGNNIPALGIETGDTLLSVENSITNFLATVINGTGIIPVIPSGTLCTLVSSFLPTSGTIDVNEYITAIIKAACSLQTQVTTAQSQLNTLNANYSIECLTGVTSSTDTHDIVQAVITKLCAVDASLGALALDVSTNYVKLSDLDILIQNYLNNQSSPTKLYTRMVPYTVVEYYGDLTPFDLSGAGQGDWEYIYLCNGANGTPDKRGRVAVGATTGMGGGPLAPAVDPAVSGNPNYALYTTVGANTITLTPSQIPSHTHPATVTISDPGHRHDIWGITGGDDDNMNNTVRFAGGDKNQGETSFYFTNTQACQTEVTGLNSSNVAVTVSANTGGDGSHSNIQPALGCYYIMCIPPP